MCPPHPKFTPFPYTTLFRSTPAGVQVSMVHLTAPDHARYPRFAAAMAAALIAELDAGDAIYIPYQWRSEEHTSELQSRENLVCRLLLEKKKDTDPEGDASCF